MGGNGAEVSLERLLAARDARAARQRALIREFADGTLLCLTVNMPGPVKRTANSDMVFEAACEALSGMLSNAGIPLKDYEQRMLPTGNEAYFVAADGAEALKRRALALESGLAYGRLVDIDVIDASGRPLSRTALGFPPRGCMVCGKEGAFCASRRAHPLEEIIAAFDRLAAFAAVEEDDDPTC